MNRLNNVINNSKRNGKKLFCAYLTLGYPNLSFTEKLLLEFQKIGVDIVELGIPFSDPIADGPIIQSASYQSLLKGTKVNDAFTLMSKLRKKGFNLPTVFFSYYNIINSIGNNDLALKLSKSGFDALLCPDLPYEEATSVETKLKNKNLSIIYLVAPTTSEKRMKEIVKRTSGFIYYVSRKGVTGMQSSLARDISSQVKLIKKNSEKVVLVGFGVSNSSHVSSICKYSDGVIVGSAIIDMIRKTESVEKVRKFVKILVRGAKL